MEEISKQYNELIDAGAPITEIYVYHLIVNDERSFNMSEEEILNMIESVIDKRSTSARSIEFIVDALLNGDELDGDENL